MGSLLPGDWNSDGTDFIKSSPDALLSGIFHHAEGLHNRYGFHNLPYVPYKLIKMKNISINKEPIELATDIVYIVIDALYINEIKKEVSDLNTQNLLDEIRSKVFPYTDSPFAKYNSEERIFKLDRIKKIDYNEIKSTDTGVFSSDSGVIVFVNEKIFLEFIPKFDYNELTDSSDDLLNTKYWYSIVSNFKIFDTAIIVSPGIDSGVEFNGSGTYKIE